MAGKFESGTIVAPRKKEVVPPVDSGHFQLSKPVYTLQDMVLTEQQAQAIEDVLSLVRYEKLIFQTWGLERVIKRGHGLKANLYGAPGTGKSMAAHAIANELGKPLLEVNYAEIESKYVGETSKNIVSLFRIAGEKDAILFFDEADALLSRRVTEMHSSSDVSVNQTRSVLLKLLDSYGGICLFTTNFIRNFDPAFMRRITRHIRFDLPNETQRAQLWKHYIVDELPNTADISLLARKFDGVSGSDIATAVLNAAIHGANQQIRQIPHSYFEQALNAVISAKDENQGGCQVSSREVSEEYVQTALKGDKLS